jgi:Ca-activated chloride channel family protein
VLCRIASLLVVAALALEASLAGQEHSQAVFRSRVERVPVATVVRTKDGRPVTNLKRTDFSLFDNGRARPITDFQSDPTPISLLLLVDLSGSMAVSGGWDAALSMAGQLELFLKPREDQVGVYTFDRRLREVAPFGAPLGDVQRELKVLKPFGITALFDAIAEAGRSLSARAGTRRAVIALTDGEDNASRLTAAQVSALASSIDVPVYIVMVGSRRDPDDSEPPTSPMYGEALGRLADLAHLTGGEVYKSTSPLEDRKAAGQIVAELRQQYLIVFEPDSEPGWHAIAVKTGNKNLVVRTRNGYLVGNRSDQD